VNPRENHLSFEEEECIIQTNIDRQLVIQDKIGFNGINEKELFVYNPIFNEYLGCYANKLDKIGKLVHTKSLYIAIPGYQTPYKIESLYCDEGFSSHSDPLRPCIQRI
ncbi:hypothetical protein ILUMI_18203, partial [Ignelater luminosus]